MASSCRYRYDALDRLASSTPAAQPDVLRFYQKKRLATFIESAVQRSIFHCEGMLLAQVQRIADESTTDLLATDQQRSVLQTVADSKVKSSVYTPYGHHHSESGLPALMGFNGEHCDPVTGHYLLGNGYRAFNPELMRFNSPDSLSPFGKGGVNTYAYCGMDPVNKVDPTGHASGWARVRSLLAKIVGRSSRHRGKMIDRLSHVGESSARVSSGVARARSLPDLRPSSDEFNQLKTLIGFHGSTQENGAFLMRGLDSSFMNSSAGLSEGRGFYLSLTRHIADDFAQVAATATGAKPKTYGVYMSHYPARISGRAYRYGLMGAGGLTYRSTREMEVVIQERYYRAVSIRNIRAGEEIVLPQASEAPF
ncbi:RHS repeat-associated core domain-containing protein [Pseudomonas viridiflava]|uniref:RHS repeat-associated core domain-containing protein n=1 Tax=Pseudomonas viridiflava TaxID=33069 RepID=UPI0015E3E688|nr:RHS repeat-associated core domain-containing protein [Pseudomonas viridiflava]MBA1232439.1 RHS repeat-associated core domain-containing protein [Pseudomonas viridiflava]